MVNQILENSLCWVMIVVAWFAYQQIWLLFLTRHQVLPEHINGEDSIHQRQLLPSVLVGALPLMGLLGTIMGLQDSFVGIVTQGADSQVVSGGIADALLTTQLGLILAIPGWLCLMYVKTAMHSAQIKEAQHHA
ncbi:MotA/TolQ/ExbB proton channel family protein [Alteromonas pelagimontana]|uniref:MotA/TolQ/ExbB proton channel family protein n=1 Tax=Alteromonas pelagimontana TaxID=1858656 RepID=A0A6M4MCJ3_9ALTE|nr:MotA/TolQ/ExbB proton channel family protein [Alteromonas pelagimontana]QJR80789.1 MotA/TolQ/ExbB proton channel family protein [Alteromonas pelagimontana]